jgi:hypothetical protein
MTCQTTWPASRQGPAGGRPQHPGQARRVGRPECQRREVPGRWRSHGHVETYRDGSGGGAGSPILKSAHDGHGARLARPQRATRGALVSPDAVQGVVCVSNGMRGPERTVLTRGQCLSAPQVNVIVKLAVAAWPRRGASWLWGRGVRKSGSERCWHTPGTTPAIPCGSVRPRAWPPWGP